MISQKKVIMALDQGTTGSRAILYDSRGKVVSSAYEEFRQYFPAEGWVEHDAADIDVSIAKAIRRSLQMARLSGHSIVAIGITNQRETTLLWNRKSQRPVARAIVWQDRRTVSYCEKLRKAGLGGLFEQKTGLVLDPYFSASKIRWLLDHGTGMKSKAKQGRLCFGTMDTWLLWRLTGGKIHRTDPTNASRTLLFNIHNHRWDPQLTKIFKIPEEILPEVQSSGSCFGETFSYPDLPNGIPIYAMMGDQQAALYGQGCYRQGEFKNTYGTGCFVVMNAGGKRPQNIKGLLMTNACDQDGRSVYALEGSIFIAGAVIQWLRDEMHLFRKASATEGMIRRLKDSGGVTFIPAFVGLGAPYWNPRARGQISGLTRGTRAEHIIRAALESIAHQTVDVVEVMEKLLGRRKNELRVDGGATANGFLMQFQADILERPVWVSSMVESTAWGAAKLEGRMTNFWKVPVDKARRYRVVTPRMKHREVKQRRRIWRREIESLIQRSVR